MGVLLFIGVNGGYVYLIRITDLEFFKHLNIIFILRFQTNNKRNLTPRLIFQSMWDFFHFHYSHLIKKLFE